MTYMRGLTQLMAVLAVILGAATVWAQEGSGQAPPAALSVTPVPWSALSPAEQQVLAPVQNKWEQLPPGAQQRLQRGAQRWSTLTPEQRDKLQERFRKWNSLN